MEATYLTLLILQINKAIDSGNHNKISIDQIHSAIERKRLLKFLKESCAENIDLSLHLSDSTNFQTEYEERIHSIYSAYAGDESRRWGVKNSGLCLALAWTNELLQCHFSSPKDPFYKLD